MSDANAKNKSNLVKSSARMGVATLLSRLLGLVREQVMASMFGASGLTDAFGIAFRIPNILRDLFAEGVFSSAFVPGFTQSKKEGDEEARKLLWAAFISLGALTLLMSISIFVWAPEIIQLFTSQKFQNNPEVYDLTVQMTQIMAPFLFFVSLAALTMGALNTYEVFFIPAMAPACFNLVMISSMLGLTHYLLTQGLNGIYSLAIGVFLGGIVQVLIQIPWLFKKGLRPTWPKPLFSAQLKSVFHRFFVGTWGVAATQVNVLVTTFLATTTQLGAVSWLFYAFRLFQFPVGILSVSLANSNLVYFSREWKNDRPEAAKDYLWQSLYWSLVTLLPALILLFILAPYAVQLIFERGAFNSSDTTNTTLALRAYLIGLPSYGLFKVLSPVFFTLDRPKIPVGISAFCVGFNIVFCWFLTPVYGFSVLALGTSLSMVLNNLIQWFYLKRLLLLGLEFFHFKKMAKLFFAALVCVLVTWAGEQLLPWSQLSSVWKLAIALGLNGMGGLLSYVAMLILLGEIDPKKLRRRAS